MLLYDDTNQIKQLEMGNQYGRTVIGETIRYKVCYGRSPVLECLA